MHFTIRDTLWLTVVVGLILGWWIDREHATRSANYRANQSEAMRRGMERAQWDRDRYRQYPKSITGYDRIPSAPPASGTPPFPAAGAVNWTVGGGSSHSSPEQTQ